MKCIKYLATTYITLLYVVAAGIIIACQDRNHQIGYSFNTSYYDSIPDMTIDSLENLFNKGITAKYLEGETYLVHNTLLKSIENRDSLGVLDWGPITTESCVYDTKNYYKIQLEKSDNILKVDLRISLINKFNKTIYKIIFRPSWISFTSSIGFRDINKLPEIEINFVNGLKYNDHFVLPILWESDPKLVQGNPLLVSSEAIVFYNDNKCFSEIMTFSIEDYLK